MSRFYEIEPTLENYWRAIILFGRNTASYKFALAKALFDLHSMGKSNFSLEELAEPYSRYLCEHLKSHPKQSTRDKSTFLNYLRSFNSGDINHDQVIGQTVRHGFNYVLDAFHNVHGAEIGTRFFVDTRKSGGGIELTREFDRLGEQFQFKNLKQETEARWRLVETAWENNISRNLMLVEYDNQNQNLIGVNSIRRTTVTSARPALNGYQKGRCFYCYQEISTIIGSDALADVDHFFPHMLKSCDTNKPIDGVVNLVLACQECNRGVDGKFDKLPSTTLLERLYDRNEYLITSHHPLRETLIAQTGNTATKRQNYLQEAYNCATLFVGSRKKWEPKPQGAAIF
ncbi:HNH endonuclease domain-containing protein [Candidatus Venteria ishoeyi]|uniref:HNH endonuclease domain-containing protein n=1 Tax=Candidatus Venteria ishoeyi TaxID=1899563 RepID=UPI0025A5E6AA|nr:HNH endonuclease domain-containing protein [Candidatus Venteria ishoeyi]MDM8545773.1 HNH endonuclease domain-containing protein [Candidatus Venteria ishoeyi]